MTTEEARAVLASEKTFRGMGIYGRVMTLTATANKRVRKLRRALASLLEDSAALERSIEYERSEVGRLLADMRIIGNDRDTWQERAVAAEKLVSVRVAENTALKERIGRLEHVLEGMRRELGSIRDISPVDNVYLRNALIIASAAEEG